jgi:hypothetical protein
MDYFGFGHDGIQRSFCEGFPVSYLQKRRTALGNAEFVVFSICCFVFRQLI